jgi:hypothetical protein
VTGTVSLGDAIVKLEKVEVAAKQAMFLSRIDRKV